MGFIAYSLRRLGYAMVSVFVLSIIVFMTLHLAPGDPALMIAGQDAPERIIQAVRERHGLDRPLLEQYLTWVSGMIVGDFGISYRTSRVLAPDLFEAFRISLVLGASALALSIFVGIPLGLLAAIKRGSFTDFSVMFLAGIGMSVPGFWLAILLILLFSLQLGWLPFSGWGTVAQAILPAIALSTSTTALMARMARSLVVETLLEDYVRTARAKGLQDRVVLVKHALRNAMAPIVTMIGLRFGLLVSGTVITESVFSIPGLGRMLVQAVGLRDFPVVQAGTVLIVVTITVINLVVDLTYSLLDPRIRYD